MGSVGLVDALLFEGDRSAHDMVRGIADKDLIIVGLRAAGGGKGGEREGRRGMEGDGGEKGNNMHWSTRRKSAFRVA